MKILVFDIGGTFIKYGVMDEQAEIGSRGRVPTPKGGREALTDLMAETCRAVGGADGIAVSLPGIIDYDNGVILMGGGGIPENTGFAMREALQKKCPVPVILENDAKCAAMAEAARGALSDVPDGIVLIFGTNIGGGIIMDHRLHRGKHAAAGEVTYIIREGQEAKPESIFGVTCGVPYLCLAYAAAIGADPEAVDGEFFFARLSEGDGAAKAVLRDYAKKIAVQIFNLQTVYDPDRFAVGGGISEQEAFIEALRTALSEIYENCPFNLPKAEVVPCLYRADANLIGAFSLWMERYGAE